MEGIHMSIFENIPSMNTQNAKMSPTEFEPIVKILVCPAKMFILEELNKKGSLEIKELGNNPHILKPSFERHLHELIDDELAYTLNEFIIITGEGSKLARDIEIGTKLSKKF